MNEFRERCACGAEYEVRGSYAPWEILPAWRIRRATVCLKIGLTPQEEEATSRLKVGTDATR